MSSCWSQPASHMRGPEQKWHKDHTMGTGESPLAWCPWDEMHDGMPVSREHSDSDLLLKIDCLTPSAAE